MSKRIAPMGLMWGRLAHRVAASATLALLASASGASAQKSKGSPAKPVSTEQADSTQTVVVQEPATPVIPTDEVLPRRAYQLHWELDVPLVTVGAALTLGREIRVTNSSAPAYCTTIVDGCDEDDLSVIDRPFAGLYDEGWSRATDVGALVLGLAPWPMLWVGNSFANALNDAVVIYESATVAVALAGLATLSAGRARPFVYGSRAPEEIRTGPNGALSFMSGHTTLAFSLSTATFWTLYRRHGPSTSTWLSLGGLTAAATFVGVGRVAAGRHFPTDVLTGAAVGASVGTLMPFVHDTPVAVIPTVDDQSVLLQVVGRL